MDDQDFALREGKQVTLGATDLVVTDHPAPHRETYRAIRAFRAGEYGFGTRVYYVTYRTDSEAVDLVFPDRDTRDRFVEALRARLD